MLRIILLLILFIIISRLFWRVVDSFIEGVSGPRGRTRVQERGVPMVRDPVCGTFVLPDRAVTLANGRTRLYFCSDACRDKYRARPSTHSASSGSTVSPVEPSTGSGRPEPVEGRTA